MARTKRPAKRKPEIMEKNKKSTQKKWNEMQYDVLLEIFATCNIMDVILTFSTVCRSWRSACSDPVLWKTQTLGLSALSNCFRVPPNPTSWSEVVSAQRLMFILKNALNLSRGNINILIFHFYICIIDDHLVYAAQRCPKVKKVVLPGWSMISVEGFKMALCSWQGLECMIVSWINSPHYIMKAIAEHCKNFSELKVMNTFDLEFAICITAFLPRLKVLSLRCSIIHKNALERILDNLEHLEVLNITHCLLIHYPTKTRKPVYMYGDTSPILLQKLQGFESSTNVKRDHAKICYRTFAGVDETLVWQEYDNVLWRADEVPSLSY